MISVVKSSFEANSNVMNVNCVSLKGHSTKTGYSKHDNYMIQSISKSDWVIDFLILDNKGIVCALAILTFSGCSKIRADSSLSIIIWATMNVRIQTSHQIEKWTIKSLWWSEGDEKIMVKWKTTATKSFQNGISLNKKLSLKTNDTDQILCEFCLFFLYGFSYFLYFFFLFFLLNFLDFNASVFFSLITRIASMAI